jgi:hemerythrin-like domain-containing protein
MATAGGTGDNGGVQKGRRPVSRPIDVLMEEHRLIEQVLGSLESCSIAIEGGLAIERPLVKEYGEFFRGFADAYHHGKEEDILFQRMIERGFPTESGPLAVMLHEHTEGRARVAILRDVGQGEGAVENAEREAVLTAATEFIPLLRQHIMKEDRILYPMALRALTGLEMEQMETAFEEFEKRLRGDAVGDRLRALAERLTSSFPPDPERMASAAAMPHCGPLGG